MSNFKYHIGSIIIDFDQINIITKIENDCVFYKPINNENDHCINSIPLNNLSLAHLRSPMTKPEVKSLLENLHYEQAIELPFNGSNRINNGNFLKDIIYLNNPKRTARVLIYLNKIKTESTLSSNDETIYNKALDHLSEEISLVNKISLDSAKSKILNAIKR
ncbi:MAG: hypothetical protein PHE32_00370 [Candidatus Shapirobacteria bacterium]|nr:hypothetical protein [Candidatus Shapirobacteria bacterium]MDD4410151.1 hypothetical protein [Candidatus Shapirobacteria bacterium]